MNARKQLAHLLVAATLIATLYAPFAFAAPQTVSEAMDGIVTRLYAEHDEAYLAKLDGNTMQSLITPEERRIFATQHWVFDVDVPAVISLLRDTAQKEMPFWLPDSGFVKTDLQATNTEDWTYEVWQKKTGPGRVELGINGFVNHRPHYLIAVGPQTPGAKVSVSNLNSDFPRVEMRAGAYAYNDWPDLLWKDVPKALEGSTLLTTIRGRSRDTHLVGAFRHTDYPSSPKPDQIMLTWSEDPRTTQTIQWRTDTKQPKGAVRFSEKGTAAEDVVDVTPVRLEDRMLANDRFIHHYTGVLRGLKPGTAYVYSVGNPDSDTWSEKAEFTTAPEASQPFTFLWTGDTHNKKDWGALMAHAVELNPNAAFYTIAGDLVGTGQYRDNWDTFFDELRGVSNRVRVMPVLGNHDSIDGLGPDQYLNLFELPKNGAPGIAPERSYAFEYGNMLMIALDCTDDVAAQAPWLEGVLKNTKATWKFASYHFPNFEPELGSEYTDITRLWSSLFDQYHVDMVFQGHVHYYLRTKPIKNEKPVESPAEGTIYVISIGIEDSDQPRSVPEFAVNAFGGIGLYQTMQIDGNRLTFRALDKNDKVHDELVIQK